MITFAKACGIGAILAALLVGGAQAADSVVVSSKIDTEGNLLGNVIAQVLQAHGVPVTNKVSLGATPIVRKAIIAGEIDIYPEYTGNAAFFFNKADDRVWKDAAKGYDAAKKLDYDANKIVWLTPAPANNTWAIGLLGTCRGRQQARKPQRLRQMGVGRRQGEARGLVRVRQQRGGAAGVPDGLRLHAEARSAARAVGRRHVGDDQGGGRADRRRQRRDGLRHRRRHRARPASSCSTTTRACSRSMRRRRSSARPC